MRGRLTTTVAACALIGVVAAAMSTSASAQAAGVPAQVVDYDPPIRLESYRYIDYGRRDSTRDDRTGRARFRVVERTGNCCENFMTIDAEGTLYDIGGTYINFTADDGRTWKQVRPPIPLVNGEGAMSVAPGGDIVGVEWDPYSGDHLVSYKYEAETEQWWYLEAPMHTPFYDRPWLTVVPGPFEIDGAEVPYVTFVDGFPHAGTYLYSTDGLTYLQTPNPYLDRALGGEVELRVAKDPDLDWVVPNTNSPISALGRGFAIAAQGTWAGFDPETQRWADLRIPEGVQLAGRVLADSRGRLHSLIAGGRQFEYRISSDEGRSWRSVTVPLPEGATVSEHDFRVNAKVGVAVVGIHAEMTKDGDGDRDFLYRLDVKGLAPRLQRFYEIGKGDVDSTGGVQNYVGARYDFESVAIFPDGRLVISFLDSTTGPIFHLAEPVFERLGPAMAIEL